MSISITWHRCKHLVINTSINIVISRNIHTTMFISKPTSIQNVISIPISISMSKRILPIHWIATAQVSAFRIAHGIGSNIDTKIIQQRSKITKAFFFWEWLGSYGICVYLFAIVVHLRSPKAILLHHLGGTWGPDERGTIWPMPGEPAPRCWGTAGLGHQNGFLITRSENPFRQAWLGN